MYEHIYQNPEAYSKNNKLQYSFAMRVLSGAQICPSDRVLDLGCGDGRITVEIAKIAHEGCIIGTDISEKMTEYANHTFKGQGNLCFLPMDSSRNIFKNQFDVITSFNSLHWVKDQLDALKGIAQAATLDARIILLLSHKKSAYHHTLDILHASPKWLSYFNNYINPRSFFTKEQYNELLANAGLSVVSLNEKEMTYEFTSLADLKAFFSASMANIKQIPSALKKEFLDDLCVEFLKQSNCKNPNQISLSFWCLEVFALKKAFINKNETKNESASRKIMSKL